MCVTLGWSDALTWYLAATTPSKNKKMRYDGAMHNDWPLFQSEATSFNMMEGLFRGTPSLDHFEKMVGTYQKRKKYGEISLAAWLTFFIYRAVRINSANRR